MNNKVLIITSLLFLTATFLYWPLDLALLKDPHSTVVKDRSGVLLSAQIANDGQWRFPAIDEVPKLFSEAIITFEDKRFYDHMGVDLRAILRALRDNLSQKRIVSGASTIPMQLARMSQRNPQRTFFQKLKEVLIALRIDWQYEKDDILKMYVSNAPYGGNVVGLEAASWRYYNKNVYELSLSQYATLAVLPNAPSLVTFTKNSTALRVKRDRLLALMRDQMIIDMTDYELAVAEPLMDTLYDLPHHAPHLLELTKTMESPGTIHTTVRADLQKQMNQLLNRKWAQLSQNDINNAAILVVDTKSSEVMAYAANVPLTRDERDVDMIQAERSSGSILKPFLYAAMLQEGLMTPRRLIRDTPIFIDGFTPSNYNRSYSGAVAADEALSRSLNIPFVLLQQEYGVDKLIRRLRRLGLSTIRQSSSHYGLSLILGGAEVTLWELTQAYTHMAQSLIGSNNSNKNQLFNDLHIYNLFNVNKRPPSFDPSITWHTFEAMKKVNRPNEFGDWEEFSSSIQMAWKTGTSFGHRDAWSIGITPEYTIGVWVGNADGEGRDELIGVSTAGSLLFEAANIVTTDNEWFQQPYDDMVLSEVCQESGYLPSPHCLNRDTVWLSKRISPSPICPYHESYHVDISGNYRVYRECYDQPMTQQSILRMPPLMAKYYRSSHPDFKTLPAIHPSCQDYARSKAMEITYPYENEKIFIPRDLNNDRQKIVLQLEHAEMESQVFWYLNKEYLGRTDQFHTKSIDFAPGEYILTCVDQNGTELRRKFQIIGERS